ncbi:MAG: YiiX/YebB-like N1pC/P60 family cysteine hydrolase [Gammaproteobacteria bacterium]
MLKRLQTRLWNAVTNWLNAEPGDGDPHLSNYERMRLEIHPADVVLVEGRSRVSNIIKSITLSSWTHAALYIGRLHDIEDSDLREYLEYHYSGESGEPLVIEALLGEGTVVSPLRKYRDYHLRVCRPKGLSRTDAELVIRHCIGCIGLDYDVRQLLDLARFLFPYGLLPRRWRSSLFAHNTGAPTRTVCSTMIGEAFQAVRFPILPLAHEWAGRRGNLQERNSKLFTPRDFDYSPYFEIIKYPMFDFDELAVYRQLPWAMEEAIVRAPGETGDRITQPPAEPADHAAENKPQSDTRAHTSLAE